MSGTALVPLAAQAKTYDLTVDPVTIDIGTFKRLGIGYNGASPSLVLRFTEGEEVTNNVTNKLSASTSIHWHGSILPYKMDGVLSISCDVIASGETFTYNFPTIRSETLAQNDAFK